MYDITRFSLADMTRCGAALRRMGEGSTSMEEVAGKIVRYLYQEMTDLETGDKSFGLVRLFKTHDYGDLEPELQRFAAEVLGREPELPGTKCLTLLATAGSKEEWNDRRKSKRHQSFPLLSAEMVQTFPMISTLVDQLGLDISEVLNPDPDMLVDIDQKAYNVFHIPYALGSEAIVDQEDFVIPEGIKSCLGFGGMLPSGNLFAVIMFSKVPIIPTVAAMFRSMSLNLKIALLPFETRVFAG